MDDESVEKEERAEDLETQRALIASVEELRALLAPLSPDERARVLQLARDLRGGREPRR